MKSPLTFILLMHLMAISTTAQARNIAVVVYAQQKEVTPYLRVAQTRMEQLLSDNGEVVLDQQKAKELQKSWLKLEDPSYLVTAEEFMEKSRLYKIDGMYRVYLTGKSVAALGGIFSATAHADFRYIDADAKVSSTSTPVMGVKGFPPSDGLTDSAAMANAIQRAIDYAAEKNGLKVLDFTNPRLIGLELSPAATPVDAMVVARTAADTTIDKLAPMFKETWTTEEATCRAISSDSQMAVIGGHVVKTTRMGGLQRVYGSRLHVLDLATKQPILALEMHPTARRLKGENGPTKIHDCLFVNSWRYIAAVTGNKLSFWDTERGALVSEFPFEQGLENARLDHANQAGKDYLVVTSPVITKAFAIQAR